MRFKSIGTLKVLSLFLLIVLFIPQITIDKARPESPYICGRIIDAKTGLPIPNATIVIWDLGPNGPYTLHKPKPGLGIYYTNEDGYYNITGRFVFPGDNYLMYVYRGNLTSGIIDYVPSYFSFSFPLFESSMEVNMKLVPGASIILKE